MEIIIYSVAIVSSLGLILGVILAVANKYIAVQVNDKEKRILGCLPGANCGSCGLAGCSAMAKAIANGTAGIDACPVANNESREAIAAICGCTATKSAVTVAYVGCRGGKHCTGRAVYSGLASCNAVVAANAVGCSYGCIGLHSCVKACPVNAISVNEFNLPVINAESCISCGKCVSICPRSLISLIPVNTKVKVGCKSTDKGKNVKDVCTAGCIGCGLCARACECNAITMVNNLPVINNDLCNGCAKCVEKCPQHTLCI